MATSWRDTTPQDVQDDLDGLFAFVRPFAEQTMTKRRQLEPFGAAVETSGKIRALASMPQGATPTASEIRAMLVDGMRADRDAFRAVILVDDIRLRGQGTDAIRFCVEHRSGLALLLVLPYAVNRGLKKRTVFGELLGELGQREVWPEP